MQVLTMPPLFSAGGPKIEEEDEPEPPEPFEWTEDWGQGCGILPLPGNNKGNWYCENFDIVNRGRGPHHETECLFLTF